MNFITGENIQNLCDIYIGLGHLTVNSNCDRSKIIYISNITKPFDNPNKIYCYTHILFITHTGIGLCKFIEKLLLFKNPFKLIFHNSDFAFNKIHLKLFDTLPLLQHIYTQNMNVDHKQVSPLPIGLANSHWTHGNPNIHMEVYNKNIEKTKEIYFNFNIGNNKGKRHKCFDIIKEKGVQWNKKLPYKEYLIELKRHKYAICPEGNGIDTHRFWECLYMNTIPICVKNKVTEYYKQYFPIIVLNDWSELNITKLEYLNEINHEFLDIKYIKQLIEKEYKPI